MMLVYCDASYEDHKSNISVAVFNEDKHCVHEKVIKLDYIRNSFQAEFRAIIEALLFAKELKITKLKLFSDCNGVVSAINYSSKNHTLRVNDVKKLCRGIDVSIEWISRKENKYADKLGR
jgi:ribonuclease HI